MSNFTGYLCWKPSDVVRTVATEAVSPSDSVFAATHAPLDIRRVTVAGGATGDDVVDERRLRDEFLNRAPNNGVLVVPVLGASGAGKSHLVRWVHVNLPPSPARRVIYLQKEQTSLSDVVGNLLLGLAGAPFDDIRRDVGQLGAAINQEKLERRLLDELAETLRVATGTTPQERALVGERGLYVLLHDPFFRATLLRDGSLIRRRAAHAINGRDAEEPEVPLQFAETDLPTDLRNIREAGLAAQKLYGQLAANDALRRAAVGLLNNHLDVAVMQAANLGVGRLQKAFLDIRRALAAEGQEIVLLVEDFALVQGIQRDLLDAILETGEREGRRVLAPIRTLLAVTTGYYESLPDTVLTRIEASSPFRYELRVTLGRRGERAPDTEQRVVDFAGRYLNAARIGRDELDTLSPTEALNVRNACDTCQFRDRCHAGFGADVNGHGLYPYNREALLRAVRSTAPENEPDAFNPRLVLARVIRHVLTEYAGDVRRHEFPNERFRADFPTRPGDPYLSPAVSELAVAAPEGERRRTLLEFWGGAPEEFGNVAPEIHEAFAIPLAADVDTIVPAGPAPAGVADPRRAENALPASVERRLQQIAAWNGRGATLHQDAARDVRRGVHAAVVARITWTDPAMRQPGAAAVIKAWPANALTISIEDASENRPVTAEPTIRFNRSPENARFFQDLVVLSHDPGRPSLAARLRLDELAERFAPVVKRLVVNQLERSDDALTQALRVSLAGAALRAAAIPGDKEAALLSAALTAAPGPRGDENIRSPLWRGTEARHVVERAEFVTELRRSLGAAQGSGDVATIDAARAVRLVKAAAKSWEPGGPPPDWARAAAVPLATVATAVDQQLELLASVAAEIRERLPKGTGFAETAKAVERAIEAGEHNGYVHADDLVGLKERNAAAAAVATNRDLDRLESDLATVDGASFETRLAVAARDRGPGLGLMRDFLVENEKWLDAGLARAEFLGGDDVAGLVARLGEVVARWRAAAGQEV